MTFFGGLLMAIGILIATLSGLCAALILKLMLNEAGGGHFGEVVSALMMPGVPFMVGIGLFLQGRAMVRVGQRRE